MKNKILNNLKKYFKITSDNWLRSIIIAIGFIAVLSYISYMAVYLLQDGYINLKARDGFDRVFYDMWMRLTQFDVTSDKDVISFEAFIINGKTIAYFLPLPALIRGILSIFNCGTYPVISILIGFTLFIIYSGLTFNLMTKVILPEVRINPVIKKSWLLFITIGSPLLAMMVNINTYWEAIVWGTAMYMICLYSSIALLFKEKNIGRLMFFGVVCGLTLFTRPTYAVGVGVLFLLTIMMLLMKYLKQNGNEQKTGNFVYCKREIISVFMLFCLFGTSLCALNFARWGNIAEFAPLDKHSYIMGKERGKNFAKYGAFRIDRIPENISYYFFPSKDNFSSERPFIKVGHSNYFMGFAKNFDYRDPTLPIPIIIPVFFAFAIVGFIVFIKNIKLSPLLPAAIAACIPGILLLPMTSQAIRYSSEFISGIIIFAIYAIIIILKYSDVNNLQTQNKRQLAVSLNVLGIAVLLLISLYIMTAGILTQRQSRILTWYGVESHPSKIISDFPLLFGSGVQK